jgi:outer membrane protein OmpA-like peptidoglycan-associated protein
MKQLFLQILFLLFISLSLYAQKPVFSVSGNVTDCKTHTLIKDAKIKLEGSDRTLIYIETDYFGNYSLDSLHLKPNRKYAIRVLAPPTNKYLNSSEVYKFETFDSISKKLINNFCLVPQTPCILGNFKIYFEKNSVKKYNVDTLSMDLDSYVMFMLDNPNLSIEINSNSNFDEINPDTLSKKRAEYLQNLIIKKGINKDRVVIKAMGSKKTLLTKDQIGKLKSIKEKEEANMRNRRTFFLFTRNDFPADKKAIQVIETDEGE